MIQQMQQELGMPTLISKPFFSIIISAYNPSSPDFQNLLQSIVDQNMSKQDIEVIIVDDWSTINYEHMVEPFKEKLNIKQVKTQRNGGNSVALSCGVDNATGVWITFIDKDDCFVSNTFSKIKKVLQKNPNLKFLQTGLEYRLKTNNKILLKYDPTIPGAIQNRDPWIHGLFFHLQDFWKKHQLHFPVQYRTHEDVAIMIELDILTRKGQASSSKACLALTTYIWYKHSQSDTNSSYYYKDEKIPRQFKERFFANYCKTMLGIPLKAYKQGKYDKKRALASCITSLYYIYQRSEQHIFKNPILIKENYECLYQLLIDFLQSFDITIEDINFYILSNPSEAFRTRLYCMTHCHIRYIQQHTFYDWLKKLYTKQLFEENSNE